MSCNFLNDMTRKRIIEKYYAVLRMSMDFVADTVRTFVMFCWQRTRKDICNVLLTKNICRVRCKALLGVFLPPILPIPPKYRSNANKMFHGWFLRFCITLIQLSCQRRFFSSYSAKSAWWVLLSVLFGDLVFNSFFYVTSQFLCTYYT